MKAAAALCLLASLAVGGPAFAAERPGLTVDNHPAHIPNGPIVVRLKSPKPDACKSSVGELLADVAANSKKVSVSPALTDKQLAYIRQQVKDHSKKEAPGDGAIVIASDGEFIVAFTKGLDPASKVCAVMPVPAAVVVGIVAAGESPAKPDAKADPDEMHL